MRDDDNESLSKWAWIAILVSIVCFTIFMIVMVVVDSNKPTETIELKLW